MRGLQVKYSKLLSEREMLLQHQETAKPLHEAEIKALQQRTATLVYHGICAALQAMAVQWCRHSLARAWLRWCTLISWKSLDMASPTHGALDSNLMQMHQLLVADMQQAISQKDELVGCLSTTQQQLRGSRFQHGLQCLQGLIQAREVLQRLTARFLQWHYCVIVLHSTQKEMEQLTVLQTQLHERQQTEDEARLQAAANIGSMQRGNRQLMVLQGLLGMQLLMSMCSIQQYLAAWREWVMFTQLSCDLRQMEENAQGKEARMAADLHRLKHEIGLIRSKPQAHEAELQQLKQQLQDADETSLRLKNELKLAKVQREKAIHRSKIANVMRKAETKSRLEAEKCLGVERGRTNVLLEKVLIASDMGVCWMLPPFAAIAPLS